MHDLTAHTTGNAVDTFVDVDETYRTVLGHDHLGHQGQEDDRYKQNNLFHVTYLDVYIE